MTASAGTHSLAPPLSHGLPFAGLLLSIALLPMLAPRFWHRRMGLVAALWGLAALAPTAMQEGVGGVTRTLWHAGIQEYLPFVTLLLALFAAGGGILLRGGPWGTPAGNTLLLAIGTLLAGVMGTTGAAMTLIHPLLRANAHRARKVHLAVFFILLVANAGGATTPLGDPPLYLGFLRGVPFFWPTAHLLAPLALLAGLLLAAFYALDRRLASRELDPAPVRDRLRLRGWVNVGLIAAAVAVVLASGVWRPGMARIGGEAIGVERLLAMTAFAAIALVSVLVTPRAIRTENLFDWGPMAEVAKLFAGMFVAIGPVLAMLRAGLDGPLAPLLRLTLNADKTMSSTAFFWLGGGLSAFLDNAPTYLVFFELGGGDPVVLAGSQAPVLAALSAGAVFFGALTYIGNAPNLMVRAIASRRGVRMPGFFGYMLWSCALLLPAFAAISLLFFYQGGPP